MIPAGGREVVDTKVFGNMNPYAPEETSKIIGPGNSHRDVADCIFHDQIPADDPGNEFAETRIGISIGAAADRDDRSKLGIAQGRKGTSHGCE